MKMFNYTEDKVTGFYHPAAYPSSQKPEEWSIPEEIRNDYSKLNTIIETKYTREFLKVCAFYNKMFPSLKSTSWTRSFYNVPPFTAMEQERSDTGTGISSNYLKQIIDQVSARLGTITFDGSIVADIPTLEYIMYKDEVERWLRKDIRNNDLNQITLEMFHDAAILGYSHAFIDPYTEQWIKASDFEIGLYESQFNRNTVRQMLYRDYAFPCTELVPYLEVCSTETKEKIIDDIGTAATVDFKMYFDCPNHAVYCTINGTTIESIEYPFTEVQMVTFPWDLGFSKVMSASLFDLLYPVQRELNKVNAKLQQMIRMYKGAVPVFNSDVDIAMKAISNGSGEALYIDSARPASELMTVINPTPLDTQLDAAKTQYKTEMYELAGLQQMSFDMENMRSAAAVIALDQTHDTVFQAQMFGHASLKAKMFKTRIHFNAVVKPEDPAGMDWAAVDTMLDEAVIELKPVHINDPMGNKGATPDVPQPNFRQIQLARYVINVLKNKITYDDFSFLVNKDAAKALLAGMMVKMDSLGIDVPPAANAFMVQAFIDDVQNGKIKLAMQPPPDIVQKPDLFGAIPGAVGSEEGAS